jgi:hypothetical protein
MNLTYSMACLKDLGALLVEPVVASKFELILTTGLLSFGLPSLIYKILR